MTIGHEDDECWATIAPILFGRERRDRAAVETAQILSLIGVDAGASILDLCCGVGRHAVELARLGYRVTGVDRTSGYLDEARERAKDAGVEVELVEEDMRSFRREGAFDAVLNLFTSFGYFEDRDDDRKVVRNIHSSLKEGGRLLMEMMGKEIIARKFAERDWRRVGDYIVLEERRLSGGWSWIEDRWIIIKGEERKEVTLAHRLYSGAELSWLLEEAGFKIVDVLGGLGGRPYDENAGRLAVLAEK